MQTKHRIEDCPKLNDCQKYADSLYRDEDAVNHYMNSINSSLCYEVNSTNEDRYEVYIDICADISLFNNIEMLENIKECNNKIRGIQVNASGINITKQGTFLKSVTAIFQMSQIKIFYLKANYWNSQGGMLSWTVIRRTYI